MQQHYFPTWIQILLTCLAILSSLISLLIPTLYFIRNKCTEHPTSLIAIISLLQALSNYNVILIAINIYNFEQFVNIARIFNIFVFYEPEEPSNTSFCDFNFIIYIVLEMMSIAYNVCFSLDLLLTIKWPFFTGKKRMKYYHICSLLFVAVITPLSVLQAQQICQQQFKENSIYKIPLTFLISLLTFYFISLLIIIYSFQTPQNSQIRKKYIQHHRLLILTLVLVWLFPIVSNLYIIVNGIQGNQFVFEILDLCSFASLVVSGGLVNIVRFVTDPYLWKQVKKMVKEARYFQESQQIDPDGQQSEAVVERYTKIQQHDVWNLPLANAVSTHHSQAVVTNIIQIVNETCADNQQQIFSSNYKVNSPSVMQVQRISYGQQQTSKIHNNNNNSDSIILVKQAQNIKKSQIKFQNLNYQFNGPILTAKEIRQHLKFGTFQQIKRITKINKKLDMVSVEVDNVGGDLLEKNVFRTMDFYESYSSKVDSVRPGTKKMCDKNIEVKTITIKVKSYAHPIFTALRKIDGLVSQKIRQTLDIGLNAENIKKARQSLGASGSFFFFSADNRLVLKTIEQSQAKVFLKILPSYYNHIVKNPQSLLCRTYGLFAVQIAGISQINFIMLENTFEKFENNNVKYRKYDLKGSTIKREVKNPNAQVLKDINFLKSDDSFLLLTQSQKQTLFQQIKSDITLLSNHNIMDYSLLLGVGSTSKNNPKNHYLSAPTSSNQKQQLSLKWRYFKDSAQLPSNKIYSISLIDYLQEFNFNKYTELTLKKLFKGGGDISSIDTVAYYNRFLGFVNRIFVVVRQ